MNARTFLRRGSVSALALVMTAAIFGCSSAQEKALEQAKKQAAATGQPQQVVSVDKDGNTTTTVVQPPAQGQTSPTVVTTTAPPPPGQPKPSPKKPMVSPVPQPQQTQVAVPAAPAEITIPAGTNLAVRVDQTIAVKSARAGDQFTGELVQPIVGDDGGIVVPKGVRVRGVIDEAHQRGRFKGASVLSLRLTSMQWNGTEYPLETRDMAERKKGKGKRTAAFIGGGSGLGMLIGGVASGGTGLLIGGLAGAGAGTAAAGLTGNRDLVIPAESILHFKLSQELVLQQGK